MKNVICLTENFRYQQFNWLRGVIQCRYYNMWIIHWQWFSILVRHTSLKLLLCSDPTSIQSHCSSCIRSVLCMNTYFLFVVICVQLSVTVGKTALKTVFLSTNFSNSKLKLKITTEIKLIWDCRYLWSCLSKWQVYSEYDTLQFRHFSRWEWDIEFMRTRSLTK